jgi:hypothetical protein
MIYVTAVKYESGYCLRITFNDGSERLVDLKAHLVGEVFEPLRKIERFQTARLNTDLDTVVWDNGADMAPEFLYEIGVPVEKPEMLQVAEPKAKYGA